MAETLLPSILTQIDHIPAFSWEFSGEGVVTDINLFHATITERRKVHRKISGKVIVTKVQDSKGNKKLHKVTWKRAFELIVAQVHVEQLPHSHAFWKRTSKLVIVKDQIP